MSCQLAIVDKRRIDDQKAEAMHIMGDVKGKNAVVLRKATGERIPVDVEALWAGRDASRDLPLEPGDTLSVPIVNEVYVAGQVHNPGRFTYPAPPDFRRPL
ncbi:MAG: hypothetical protein HGA24_02300 [Candidatus Aminicenantes bacterium]|nr:hypothetical protein [Candidatus Aminicenantes bacterium]